MSIYLQSPYLPSFQVKPFLRFKNPTITKKTKYFTGGTENKSQEEGGNLFRIIINLHASLLQCHGLHILFLDYNNKLDRTKLFTFRNPEWDFVELKNLLVKLMNLVFRPSY